MNLLLGYGSRLFTVSANNRNYFYRFVTFAFDKKNPQRIIEKSRMQILSIINVAYFNVKFKVWSADLVFATIVMLHETFLKHRRSKFPEMWGFVKMPCISSLKSLWSTSRIFWKKNQIKIKNVLLLFNVNRLVFKVFSERSKLYLIYFILFIFSSTDWKQQTTFIRRIRKPIQIRCHRSA